MSQKQENEDLMPDGVTLRDPLDFSSLRSNIFEGVAEDFKSSFPYKYGDMTLDVEDVEYIDPDTYSIPRQFDALMGDEFLGRRLRGKMVLRDAEGHVLDSKKQTLMKVPYLTDRGTFIHNGSSYSSANQIRLMPGVYTRRKNSGELEAQFNAKRGSGSNFTVRMDPETGVFRLRLGSSNIKLYSLLSALGYSDDQLKEKWGTDIFEINKDSNDPRDFEKAYTALMKGKADAGLSREEKVEQIREALNSTLVSREVLSKTVPKWLENRTV